MLNMSVAPQVKSSAENALALVDADSTDGRAPVAEEFGKILEREVAEVTNKPDTANDKQETAAERQPETTAPSADNIPDQTRQDKNDSLAQTILNDTTSAYKIDASLKPMGVNLEAMTDAPTSAPASDANMPFPGMQPISAIMQQQVLTSSPVSDTNMPFPGMQPISAIVQQQVLTSSRDEQVLSSALPMVNQLLQQKLMQQNLEERNLAALSNNLMQSLELENSAAYGKVLPLAVEASDMARNGMGETFAPILDEAITTQSFGLNSTAASTAVLNAAAEKVHVDAPVGHAKWGGELAQKVVWMASQQTQMAEIHLNPAHLGPVEVMLSISQDQATAQFVSSHPAVRDAIQDALPRLREMLAESGIQLGDVMVGSDSFQQDNKQQQQAHQSDRGVSSMTETRTETAGAAIEATVMPTRHHGIVNTYA